MEKKIFIASTEQRSGKSLVTIGLISALQGIVPRVGFMRPIGQRYESGSGVDDDALLVKGIFNLTDDLGDINPVSMDDAKEDKDALYQRIFDSYNRLAPGKDIVVIEGTDYTSAVSVLEFDINAELASNLAAPVLLVANGSGRSEEDIVQIVTECADSFRQAGCNLLGAVINRYDQKDETVRISALLGEQDILLFGIIPSDPTLSGPRLKEVAKKLKAEILYRGDDLDKVVTDVRVLAMTPENALDYMKEQGGFLLITPGDRIEHIFTCLLAQKSLHYPSYSGLILTGGLLPGTNVRKLIEGIADAGLTILSVPDDTYTTALQVDGISGDISADDKEKIGIVNHLIGKYVDIQGINARLGAIRTDSTTPRMFQYRILEMAKAEKKHIVLPEGTEKRILLATAELLDRGICDITLLGDPDRVIETARGVGADIEGAVILDPPRAEPAILEQYAETLYQLRKHKGVTSEMARDTVLDPIYHATMMLYMGHADGFVSGSTHSTADTLGPVLRVIKTPPGILLASSIFFMCMPDQVLVYGDCALVENPDAEQLADIAITSAETARSFGIDPYVAILSYSTGESGRGKDVDKVRQAARIASQRRPELPIEGPIQYDAAFSEEVARVKIRDSKVAGKATVYIFPDLDSGNTAYKAVQRSARVPAIGPILQGLNKPANDLSRGAEVVDIVYTVAVTAVQAQKG
jgi:phosphate acetyltransferase